MKHSYILIFIFFMTNIAFTETKQRVVVLNFKPINVQKDISDAVTEIFITSLASTNKYHVIERSQLDSIFSEMKLTKSEEFDDSQILEIGRLAKSEIAFIGSITKIGNVYSLNSRAIDIQTGNVILAESSKAESENDITFAIDKIISGFNNGKQVEKKIEPNEEATTINKKEQNRTNLSDLNSNSKPLYDKFSKRKNSGVSLLISGLILSVCYAPAAALFSYADELRFNSIDYETSYSDLLLADTISAAGYLFIILGIVGTILFIISIPVLISSIVLYSRWKTSTKKLTLAPLFENRSDTIRIGLKYNFNIARL